jgi:hypothetical protein
MSEIFFIAALVSLAAVVASLLWGFRAMTKEGERQRIKSNKMMQLRVLFQGLTIFFLFLAYLARD